MKILLINPPQEKEVTFAVPDDYDKKARSHNPPLGLMYLYSYMSPKYDVTIIDMSAKEMNIADISAILDQHKPHVVGITCVISKWPAVMELAKLIRAHKYSPIVVVGGVNPSLYTFETLQCKDINYVIRGFGQVPFMLLCDAIWNRPRDGSPMPHIENCFTRDNYPERITGTFTFADLDLYPLPNRTVLCSRDYDMPYSPENPTTPILTSLGCPHKCAFCQCRTFKPLTIRAADKVVDEMQEIQNLGFKSLSVQDELFAMSSRRIHDICSRMSARGINLHWGIRARANPLTMDSLELMKKTGCYNVHMGIESGCPRTLERMNKKTTIAQIKESVRRIKEVGLSRSASFMLGYPGETKEEILETIQFAQDLDLNSCQFYVTIPSFGTDLYKEWQRHSGYTGDILSDFTLNPDGVKWGDTIASDLFSKQEMIEFSNLAYSKTNNLYKIKQGVK